MKYSRIVRNENSTGIRKNNRFLEVIYAHGQQQIRRDMLLFGIIALASMTTLGTCMYGVYKVKNFCTPKTKQTTEHSDVPVSKAKVSDQKAPGFYKVTAVSNENIRS